MAAQDEMTVMDGYLLIRMLGEIDGAWVARSKQTHEERWKACQQAGVDRVLLDIRGATVAMDIGDRYDVGVTHAESPLSRVRVALLGTKEQSTPDKFFQKVAQNRGAQVRVFFDEQEAIAWAKGE